MYYNELTEKQSEIANDFVLGRLQERSPKQSYEMVKAMQQMLCVASVEMPHKDLPMMLVFMESLRDTFLNLHEIELQCEANKEANKTA